ncbi:MAG: NNP family nitrate/nitrite transporter-like MFS transporter [Planctomycetota bacterium]|jgi:NNP family nitrate/nitrite transporter-like MFS transporter
MKESSGSVRVLIMNTLAFTICFACWMMNGVLITFLVENNVYQWDKAAMGWLIGIPVLTGAVTRLPVGVLTDKYGGRKIYTAVMILSAIPLYLVGYADSYLTFMLCGLGFGLAGASFAVGIAYTSVWFTKQRQGTALGIFGAGNAGAAITSMCAPSMLRAFTDGGANIEGWRTLPKVYAAVLIVTAIVFWFTTIERKPDTGNQTLRQRLAPLRHIRVWRFGFYYFFVFGGFVALAQWLIPYYVNTYAMSVATAGLMASIFTLPSGVIRALGGWMSDKIGARSVMYWVLGLCCICSALLIVPKMDIESPGAGVMAMRGGTVTAITENSISVGDKKYALIAKPAESTKTDDESFMIFPTGNAWQEPAVEVGDEVAKKQLIARGITHIYFQSNVWIFTALVFVVGIMMGIGKAAVYKHIPDYFPDEVGVVGGMVGVLGGLGGFVCPIIFGYMLKGTGLWTTCWMFFFVVTLACLVWMHLVIRKMMKRRAPELAHEFEDRHSNKEPAPAGGNQ